MTGQQGSCSSCQQQLGAGEVVQAKGRTYHKACWRCSMGSCGRPLGKEFYPGKSGRGVYCHEHRHDADAN